MDRPDLIIRSSRVVTPENIRPASVHIRDGVIAALGEWDEIPPRASLVEAGDAVVMPGLVDSHVHVNEPGRTRWEGFATATRAAAAGGVTTLVDDDTCGISGKTRRGTRAMCYRYGFLGRRRAGQYERIESAFGRRRARF
jgi:dihydroorotase-like cyclic amidohydrolase